mmetsp:Transcript_19292/g.62016  ORF Transcript_19292/g.62016 Transcript_19292/m.62016 type:complete len:192 (+) Transcript_19292:253-828(+)
MRAASSRTKTKAVEAEKAVEPLEEEEQLKIVRELRVEGAKLDRFARWACAVVNGGVCVGVLRCAFLLVVHVPRYPGDYALEHHALVSAEVRFVERLLVAYSSTAVVLCLCAVVSCLGGTRRLVRLAAVAAVVPALLWTAALRRLEAPLPTYWIVGAAPLALALSLYVDRDLSALALDITNLDSLRYKYKGV